MTRSRAAALERRRRPRPRPSEVATCSPLRPRTSSQPQRRRGGSLRASLMIFWRTTARKVGDSSTKRSIFIQTEDGRSGAPSLPLHRGGLGLCGLLGAHQDLRLLIGPQSPHLSVLYDLKNLRVRVRHPAGGAHVHPKDRATACAVDPHRVLYGVAHHHSPGARQPSQRLAEHLAVALPLAWHGVLPRPDDGVPATQEPRNGLVRGISPDPLAGLPVHPADPVLEVSRVEPAVDKDARADDQGDRVPGEEGRGEGSPRP
mmetsp:Transcript_5263/g.18465  ORF Transcript_5263/g.18465 Transcript_5263/m.18465 type:complete len:259 (-) Transcript_5263:643-1419(-)